MNVVGLSAVRSGDVLVLISVRSWLDPRPILRLQGLSEWKLPMTPLGTEPATFRLVVQCLSQLRHHMLLQDLGLFRSRFITGLLQRLFCCCVRVMYWMFRGSANHVTIILRILIARVTSWYVLRCNKHWYCYVGLFTGMCENWFR